MSAGGGEVFGCHLNKQKPVKKTGGSDRGGKSSEGKGPTWKLRKWTKEGGYKTVVGGMASSTEEKDLSTSDDTFDANSASKAGEKVVCSFYSANLLFLVHSQLM